MWVRTGVVAAGASLASLLFWHYEGGSKEDGNPGQHWAMPEPVPGVQEALDEREAVAASCLGPREVSEEWPGEGAHVVLGRGARDRLYAAAEADMQCKRNMDSPVYFLDILKYPIDGLDMSSCTRLPGSVRMTKGRGTMDWDMRLTIGMLRLTVHTLSS